MWQNIARLRPELFDKYQVKRGLRNIDGTGVMAGLTNICNVHGYLINDGERVADEGRLTYRGIDIKEIVNGCLTDGHFGFEEVAWLLLFGKLPTRCELDTLCDLLYEYRELPEYFAEDMIIKAPSKNIMNKLARSVLALYSYDDNPDDTSLSNCVRQSLELIARLPTIMTYAYQVKRRHFDKKACTFTQSIRSTGRRSRSSMRSARIKVYGRGSTAAGSLPGDPCGARRWEQFNLFLPSVILFGDRHLFGNCRCNRKPKGTETRRS